MQLDQHHSILLRASHLSFGPRTLAELVPWKRAALLLYTKPHIEPASFDRLDWRGELAERLGMARQDSLGLFAKNMFKALQEMHIKNREALEYRLFFTNQHQCAGLDIPQRFGDEDSLLDQCKYDVGDAFEDIRSGIAVAKIKDIEYDGKIYRGPHRNGLYKLDKEKLPEYLKMACDRIWQGGEAYYDHISCGPFGIRIGAFGWNSYAGTLGLIINSMAKTIPSKFKEPELHQITTFPDPNARIVTKNGWVLSIRELTSPVCIQSFISILLNETTMEEQLKQVHRDIDRLCEEMKVRQNLLNPQMASLFVLSQYLHYDKWMNLCNMAVPLDTKIKFGEEKLIEDGLGWLVTES